MKDIYEVDGKFDIDILSNLEEAKKYFYHINYKNKDLSFILDFNKSPEYIFLSPLVYNHLESIAFIIFFEIFDENYKVHSLDDLYNAIIKCFNKAKIKIPVFCSKKCLESNISYYGLYFQYKEKNLPTLYYPNYQIINAYNN